jgi:hypothetical protein
MRAALANQLGWLRGKMIAVSAFSLRICGVGSTAMHVKLPVCSETIAFSKLK